MVAFIGGVVTDVLRGRVLVDAATLYPWGVYVEGLVGGTVDDEWGGLVKARSRRLLLTTNTLDNAMAAPASMGLSSPSAASGIAATL